MRISPHCGTSPADRLRLTGFGPMTSFGSGSSASAASCARSPSVGRVPVAAGRCTSRGCDRSCGKAGVSEATWRADFGRSAQLMELGDLRGKLAVGGPRPAHVLWRNRAAVARLVLGAAAGEQQGKLGARQARPRHEPGRCRHARRAAPRSGSIPLRPFRAPAPSSAASLPARRGNARPRPCRGCGGLAGLAADLPAQHVVGAARAVAGDDINWFVGASSLCTSQTQSMRSRSISVASSSRQSRRSAVDLLHRLGDALAVASCAGWSTSPRC